MYTIELNTRFTYRKTSAFWNSIKSVELALTKDSIDYTVAKRDYTLFQLCYSYGLMPTEALNLTRSDFNFGSKETDSDAFGSVYVAGKSSYNVHYASRLVYPIFPEITEEICGYLDIYDLYFKTPYNSFIFASTKGNQLTMHYMNYRLKYYNSKVRPCDRIQSLNHFRQYYIADLLRIPGISQAFINNQIGNNILSNQVYSHLQPNKYNGVSL